MLDQTDWADLRAVGAGDAVDTARLERLKALKLVIETPRGELKLTGKANEALTYLRHGFDKSLAKLLQDDEPDGDAEGPDGDGEIENVDTDTDLDEAEDPAAGPKAP